MSLPVIAHPSKRQTQDYFLSRANPYGLWMAENRIDTTETLTLVDPVSGNNVSNPAQSNKPSIVTSADFNNLPVARFSGVDDYLINNTANFLSEFNTGYIAGAVKLITGNNLHVFTSTNESVNNQYFGRMIRTSGDLSLLSYNTLSDRNYITTDDPMPTEAFAFAYGSNGANMFMIINGAEVNITVVQALPNAERWWNDITDRTSFVIGALIQDFATDYANIDLGLVGAFPFQSIDHSEGVCQEIADKYGF